jgi:hypothetical protein
MLAIRRHRRPGALEVMAGWVVLSLAFRVITRCLHRAGHFALWHSTVDDAWGPAVASQAKSFLVRLQRAGKADDKAQFASLVHYPIRVISKDHSVEISSSRNLIKKYSAPSLLSIALKNRP